MILPQLLLFGSSAKVTLLKIKILSELMIGSECENSLGLGPPPIVVISTQIIQSRFADFASQEIQNNKFGYNVGYSFLPSVDVFKKIGRLREVVRKS